MFRSAVMMAVTAVLACGVCRPALSADRTWGNTGTDYNLGTSWAGGSAPNSADAAVFNQPATTQPNLSASLTNQQVRFSTATSTGYTLSAGAGFSLTLTSTGAGTTAGTGAAIVAANTSGTNTISAPIILGAAAGSTQYVSMSSVGALILSGNISQQNSGIALRLALGNSSVLRLSGSNSFTGGLTIDPSGGSSVLEIGSNAAIPTSGTFSFLGNNSLTIRQLGATTRTISIPLVLNSSSANGRITFERDPALSSGATVFSGPGTLGANTTVASTGSSAVVFESTIGETGGSRNFTHGSQGGINSVQGYLFLMAANTWSGTTTLNVANSENRGATFTVARYLANSGTADSFGSNTGGNTTVAARGGNSAGTIIRYIGGQATSNRAWNWGDSASSNPLPMAFDASGSGPLTLTGNLNVLGVSGTSRNTTLTFDGVSNAANTFASVIANASTGTAASTTSITKGGLGTWVLNAANTFSGTITVNSGRLVLDYATNAAVLGASNAVSLSGGALELKAHPTTATAQTLGNITVAQTSGAGVSRLVFSRPGAGTLAMTTGTLSRTAGSNAGFNALYVDNTAAATLTGTVGLTNGIAYWAAIADTSGTGFLTTSGVSLARYTAATTLANNSTSATTNYKHNGSMTLTAGNKSYYTLDVDTTGGGTLTIPSTNSVTTSGLLFTGNGNFTIASGTLVLGQTGDNYFHQYSSGVATISSALSTANNTNRNLTKTGLGTLELSGAKASNGGKIVILEGALRASDASVLDPATFATGNYIVLGGGGVVELGAGNYTGTIGTAAGSVQWAGDGGFSAFGSTRTVTLNSGSSITWAGTNFVPANNALVLGGRDSNAMVDFTNPLDFIFQQRVVRVQDGVSSADIDARLSGVLSGNYGGGLIKDGAGSLELTAANTYLGETWVQAGRLLVNGTTSAASVVTVSSGAVLGGTGRVGGEVAVSGGIAPGSTGIGTLTTGSGVTWNSGNAWLFQLGTPAASLAAATAGTDNDFLNVASAFTQGSGSTFTFDFFSTGSDGWYKLVDYTSTTFATGTNTSFQASNVPTGKTATFLVDPGSTALYVQIVPEPATMVLAAVGVAMLAWACRRRKAV